MIGIFFPVDRRHMGWIFIKVRSPDSKLRVRVDRALAKFFAKVTFIANTRGLASLGGERYTAIALDACQLTYSEVPWLENGRRLALLLLCRRASPAMPILRL